MAANSTTSGTFLKIMAVFRKLWKLRGWSGTDVREKYPAWNPEELRLCSHQKE